MRGTTLVHIINDMPLNITNADEFDASFPKHSLQVSHLLFLT